MRQIESGIAAAAFRIAAAAPTLACYGPAGGFAALLTSWISARRARPAA